MRQEQKQLSCKSWQDLKLSPPRDKTWRYPLVVVEWLDAAEDTTAEGNTPAGSIQEIQLTLTPGWLLGVSNPGTPTCSVMIGRDHHPNSLSLQTLGQYHVPEGMVFRCLEWDTHRDIWPEIKRQLRRK